jgi:hypothetical protein
MTAADWRPVGGCQRCPATRLVQGSAAQVGPSSMPKVRGTGQLPGNGETALPSGSSRKGRWPVQEVWLPIPGSHRLIDVTGRGHGRRPGGRARSAHHQGTKEGVGVTSVLTRDPGLETMEESVLVRRGTMDIARTTGPAGVRRGSTAEDGRIQAVASLPIDVVDLWGMQSFPASDPPANW